MQTSERQPHAILDLESRLRKARKIATLVGPLSGKQILDIGTGSGFIASSLAAMAGSEGEVWAVDVNDQRRTTHGYSFRRVDGTNLPFEDGFFDVVLSNHVIEHVGERAEQLNHLREIKRVLRPGGRCYLAVPNRWGLVEPHFGLPFLSWVPQSWRTPYVRLAGRGSHYDCNLPTRKEIRRLFDEAEFSHAEVTIDAMRVFGELEQPSPFVRLLCKAPQPLLQLLLPVNPTMIFVLGPASETRLR